MDNTEFLKQSSRVESRIDAVYDILLRGEEEDDESDMCAMEYEHGCRFSPACRARQTLNSSMEMIIKFVSACKNTKYEELTEKLGKGIVELEKILNSNDSEERIGDKALSHLQSVIDEYWEDKKHVK